MDMSGVEWISLDLLGFDAGFMWKLIDFIGIPCDQWDFIRKLEEISGIQFDLIGFI
jgi:hypothetical protein